MREFAALIALFALEHLAMCVPTALLLANLRRRHSELDRHFPALPEEVDGVASASALLATGVASAAVVTPALQVAILVLYYARGHPWARLFCSTLLRCEGSKDEAEAVDGDPPEEWYRVFGDVQEKDVVTHVSDVVQ